MATSAGTVFSQTQTHGSNLRNTPNLAIGVDQAPIRDPITGAPVLAPTFQTSCTMRSGGYIGRLRLGSIVPSNGTITRVRIRSGSNPARVRVVIMQGSAGLYGTVRRRSPLFNLRPNRVTTLTVNLPVRRTFTPGQQVTDAVALSFEGPGTLPLFDYGTSGTFTQGTGLLQHWYPQCIRGVPRNGDAYTVDGIELLMQWEFVPAARPIN